MKLSVSAYRAHASAHKKILDTAYQLNYGATSASHHVSTTQATPTNIRPFQIDDPASEGDSRTDHGGDGGTNNDGTSSDDTNTPLKSPLSQNTSREEDDEEDDEVEENPKSKRNEPPKRSAMQRGVENDIDDDDDHLRDDHPSPSHFQYRWRNLRAVMAYYHALRKIKRAKSNQRWMKLRTTVQISSAMQKKPALKREDSFLQRFSSRPLIAEAQETLEDTGSECGGGGGGTGGDDGGGGDNGGGGPGAPGPGGGGDDARLDTDAQQRSTARRKRRARRRRQPRTVVNPDENFYFHWLLVQTIAVLYNLWTLIVRQSFPECQSLMSGFWLGCDCLSDICFVLDVVVQLRTGYLEQGLMVYDARKLAAHYVRSRAFLLDIIAVCPLDLLQLRLGAQPLLRFPRFLKAYRAVNYYYMVESRTVYPNLWRVVNLIHILLILAHWFGCFYFLLSEAEGFQGDWVYPYRPGDYATLTRKYLGSLYWSTLTLTTIGDLPTPETNAEYVFTIVSYLIGVFIFATIVGQVGNVITNRNANRLEFERLLDGAKTYMRHHKVPGGMKRRVLRWYDYSWSRGRIQGGGDINTALGLLPDKLKTELALHVNLSVLKKVTIFQECQPEFLRDLVLKMRAFIFTPGDAICRKGEVAREMFIIADGILEVCSEAGRVLTTMKAGDFFGEIGILNLDGLNKYKIVNLLLEPSPIPTCYRRTADVRSVGYSELFSLSREDVLAAMKDYPEAQDILQALGRKRLMEVKASARQHRKAKKEATADSKRLVDKIRSEAKGLRNALRKSKSHRRSHESLDQESSRRNTNKAILKRMSHVRSDELSQEDDEEDEEEEEEEQVATENVEPMVVDEKVRTSPLGAGLPLLARLRLLKEKQDNEERSTNEPTIRVPSPPLVETEGPVLPSVEIQEVDKEEEVQKKPLHWRKLKKAVSLNSGENPSRAKDSISASSKRYRSVDDLSPEYGRLPFVKQLKILNERQKLEELEATVVQPPRSLSVGDDSRHRQKQLTRSRSEGSTMHDDQYIFRGRRRASVESNETLERHHLKSILKKLTEEGAPAVQRHLKRASTVEGDLQRQLMRAPTVEGYAARHAKLAKSVTFNRNTLPSPPGVPIEQQPITDVDPQHIHVPPTSKGGHDVEQQYFADILMAIKQMMGAQLIQLQDRYEERLRRLEDEVRTRDATIEQLHAHIADLEKSTDDSFTESMDTVVSTGIDAITTHHHPQHVVLEVDSTTDTEDTEDDGPGEDGGDSGDTSDPASGNDWELEMLAAQMRQQRRSASLDPATWRPVTHKRAAIRHGGGSCSCDSAD